MSFVLDALKRSEQDRKVGQSPSFVDHSALIHVRQDKRVIWPYLLTGVLLLNAGVFVFLHFHSNAENAESKVNTNTETPSAARELAILTPSGVNALPLSPDSQGSDTSAITKIETIAGTPTLREPVSSGSGDIDWAAKEAEAKRLIEASIAQEEPETNPIAEGMAVRIDPYSAPRAYDASALEKAATLADAQDNGYEVIKPKNQSGDALPFPAPIAEDISFTTQAVDSAYAGVQYLYEMDARARPSVPKLTFNSHIYSDTPSARRVMINNIYLREGQSFQSMEVKEIGENDIVFEKRGVLFKLPAMRDWNG